MICYICHNEFSSSAGLSNHIIKTHKMAIKKYYDTYYRTDSEGICIGCGKPTAFLNLTKGYRKFCSRTCCNKSEYHQVKMQNTIISKYGGMGTASKIINEKIKNTNIKKYGAKNVYASEYGKQKIKETNLKRFGVEYAFQSPIVKNKIMQKFLEKSNAKKLNDNKSS